MSRPKRAITRDIRTRRPKRTMRDAEERDVSGWPESTIVARDLMTRPVTTFRTDMTVGAAAKAMRARKIRHAPVLDARGEVVGVVSDGDLRQVVLEPAVLKELEGLGHRLDVRTLKDVMTWSPITVNPDTRLREIARTMHANKIGCVPVVDRGRVVGMLTGSDVLQSLIRIMDEGVVSKPARWGAEA
jgi:acetoin utilization protein AcuB